MIARLDRIEELEREGAPAAVLLDEVRALLREAEAWVRSEPCGTEAAGEALERCRGELAQAEITHGRASRTLLA